MRTQNPDPAHTETVRERDVIVTGGNGSKGSNGPMMAIAGIVAIAAIALLGWFVVTSMDADTVIPDEVNVNVDGSSDGGDTGSSDTGSDDTSSTDSSTTDGAAGGS